MKLSITCCFLLASFLSYSQLSPGIRPADKIRIREAITIAADYSKRLYPGFGETAFIVLLVTDSTEFLINHPRPSADFKGTGYDSLLKSEIYYRKRQFPTGLLATFPAVNGYNCIVVGTPENTGLPSSAWVITLLHEHFHQYQYTDTGYYSAVNKLDLSGGDQTGMWMLDFPFPYDSLPVADQFHRYKTALYDALVTRKGRSYQQALAKYRLEREKLKNVIGARNYAYLSFQLWQEGIARYTEYEFLKLMENFKPSRELQGLPDFTPFAQLKEDLYKKEMKNLLSLTLPQSKRIIFYTTGFAEGLLLNKLNKNWREKYISKKFYLEAFWPVAR